MIAFKKNNPSVFKLSVIILPVRDRNPHHGKDGNAIAFLTHILGLLILRAFQWLGINTWNRSGKNGIPPVTMERLLFYKK
jgi:hypothetical protein